MLDSPERCHLGDVCEMPGMVPVCLELDAQRPATSGVRYRREAFPVALQRMGSNFEIEPGSITLRGSAAFIYTRGPAPTPS